MDRAEATGFGVATAGHLALLAALSLGFANAVRPPIMSPPMEVSFVEDVALESAAPTPALEEPAARLADTEGPVEPSAPAPAPEPVPLPEPVPVPQPKAKAAPTPAPTPAPKAVERPRPPRPAPTAKAAPPKAQPKQAAAKARPAPKQEAAKSTGRLEGLLTGISDRESASRSTAPTGRTASAAVKSSLGAEVRRQLKPHWRAPTGADADQLRTELSITLAPNGAVIDIEVLRTTGQTDSNRPQVKLHQEQAVRAARLASPFKLPPEYYDAWKLLSPIGFDKRLSQ